MHNYYLKYKRIILFCGGEVAGERARFYHDVCALWI